MNSKLLINNILSTLIVLMFTAISVHAQNEEKGESILQNADIGGYGEMVFYYPTAGVPENQQVGTIDFRRFVLETGYRFTDDITFHSELEVEHTRVEAGEKSGEISVEEAYLDFKLYPALNIRTGIMLVPVGLTNLKNEPVDYLGVNRPPVERYIIPSTWSEAGAGIYGDLNPKVSYQLAFMAGLDPSGLSNELGIREARQEGFESSTQNVSVSGRIDYHFTPKMLMGVSSFYSGLANKKTSGGALKGAEFSMYEFHLRWKNDRYQLKGLAVLSHIAKSDKINRYYGKQVGSKQYGLYAVAAVNMRKWFENSEETESQLWVFSRISQLNTQASPVGFRADKSNEQTDFAIGINYNPIEDVVIKADYQWIHHPTMRTIQQVNIGLGFDF